MIESSTAFNSANAFWLFSKTYFRSLSSDSCIAFALGKCCPRISGWTIFAKCFILERSEGSALVVVIVPPSRCPRCASSSSSRCCALEENDELDAKVDVNLLLFPFKSSALSIARREQIIVDIIVLSRSLSFAREAFPDAVKRELIKFSFMKHFPKENASFLRGKTARTLINERSRN